MSHPINREDHDPSAAFAAGLLVGTIRKHGYIATAQDNFVTPSAPPQIIIKCDEHPPLIPILKLPLLMLGFERRITADDAASHVYENDNVLIVISDNSVTILTQDK